MTSFPMPCMWLGGRRVGGGSCRARGSRCGPSWTPAPAVGLRQGVAPSRWGAPRCGLLGGGGAFAVGGGERGSLVSGDVEEGVVEEVSDALA